MSALNTNISHTSRTNLIEAIEMRQNYSSLKARRFSDSNEESIYSSLIGSLMILVMVLLIMATFPFSLFFCLTVIHDHEKAVLFRNGRLLSGNALGPGVVFIIPLVDNFCVVDLRTVCYDIPPQQVLTKDSITIDVDAVLLYHVNNAVIAVINVEDFGKATKLLAATSLRNVLGTKTLAQILSDSQEIGQNLKIILDEATDYWGIKIERIDIKNVRLPLSLQRAMASEAQASREARAKIIEANGEQKASQALAEAADVMQIFPAAIQLRYLQTLANISNKGNHTIVFPFPNELFQNLDNEDNEEHIEVINENKEEFSN